jgi:voltage-gated potassium channel
MDADEIFFGAKPRKRIKKQKRRISFVIYQALYGPIAFVKAVYRQLFVLLAVFVWGAAIFSYYDHLSWVNALLASVSTITTIGIYVPNGGNFFALDQNEAVLLIILIIISVAVLASIVQSMVSMLVDGHLARNEAQKQLIKRLKNHIIVFGYSYLGKYVIEKLEQLGFDYVIMTKDHNKYTELLQKNVFVIYENETQPIEALKSANVESASMIVVAHEKDAENMLILLTARRIRPDIRLISVVHDPQLTETAKCAGADMVIPTSVTVGHLLALSAINKGLIGLIFSDKFGAKEIAEFSIHSSSKLIGKGLQEIAKYGSIIGVVRDGQLVNKLFDCTFTLKENDTLLVLGDTEPLFKLEKQANVL